MQTKHQWFRHSLITVWTIAVILFIYVPTICITLASLTASRYFQFPIAKFGFKWRTRPSARSRSGNCCRRRSPSRCASR